MRRRPPLLTDTQWGRILPHLPKPKTKPKGSRPRADDRACLEGVFWVLGTDARRDLPEQYPSPATCWRRLGEWERQDVWLTPVASLSRGPR